MPKPKPDHPTPAPKRPRGRPRKLDGPRGCVNFALDADTEAALGAIETHVVSLDPMARAVSRSDLARWAIRAMAAQIPSATMDASPKSS